MYLKSLSLKGFKSFADKTQMGFDPGLNVVVGPNGSGKSNVSDAVLWVLGEQSPKMLRGQAMEDVIFSGSSARQPVGVAEVTLVLDNTDHTLPIEFAEVAITRRMYRSGESEYLVNGAPSRLRDIQDILHDSGLGKDTHSIISQGKLDSVLSGRPEERRELIEEAAGISKHRRRKERAEKRLDAMDANLVRAKDVQRELGRQLRPLEKQVDQARRHRELREQLTAIETALAVDDLRQLQASYRRLSADGREAEAACELASYRLAERNKELERYQSLLEQKGIFVGDLGEQRRRMQGLLAQMDADMRLLEEKGKNMVARLSELRMELSATEKQLADARRDRAEAASGLAETKGAVAALQAAVAEIQAQAAEATERRRELGATVGKLSSQQKAAQHDADQETLAYARLRDQIESAEATDELYAHRLARIVEQLEATEADLAERGHRKEEAEGELEGARAKLAAAKEAVRELGEALEAARAADAEARRVLTDAQADLAATEAVDRASENASDLARALAEGSEGGRVRCRLADVMEVPTELEGLVEALLGDDLAALVVEGDGDVVALAGEAAGAGEPGVATLLAQDAVLAAGDVDLPGAALAEQVSARPGYEALVGALLGKVRLVEDASAAVAAHREQPGCTYVARDGAVAWPDGRVVVGQASSVATGALERKRHLRALHEEVPRLQEAADGAAAAMTEADQALSDARERESAAQAAVARLQGEVSSLSSEVGRLSAQRDATASERDQVQQARSAAAEKVEEAREEVARHRKAADEATSRARELADRLEEASTERNHAADDERDAQRRLGDERLRLATTIERRNHLDTRERELARTEERLAARVETTRRSAASLDVVRLRVDPLYERYEAVREKALEWAGRLKDRASLEEANSDSLKKTIAEARAQVDEATSELDAARSAAEAVRVEMGKVEVEVRHAVEAIQATGQVLEEALELPAPDDRAASERQAERLRRQLEQMGPVNEVAMEEYERLRERADYIASQVADLERARTSLQRITRAIERKMRRQFLTVFDQVNANFSEVFGMLFPGGQAHLSMDDPDHPDATGIEIHAQPRGKRIAKMMLMSGGEKSLTALALLFAVYRTRTVPFYIFDEVEAALDDANLTKLLGAIEQLKESTQLIVISHQRRTMEQADVLYGVSMRADGVSHVVSQRLDRATGKVVDA